MTTARETERLRKDNAFLHKRRGELVIERDALKAENERLMDALDVAVEWLATISSGDGSGHADLSRRLVAMRDAALTPKEPSDAE